MRILLISKKFDYGGSENHLCDLANGLAELGHQVHLLAADGRQRSRLDRRVQFTPVRFSDALLPVHLLLLFSLIRDLRIQVIHAHQRLAVRVACMLGRLTGVPVVATVHGRTRHDLGSRFFRNQLARVIFVSRHVQQRAMRYPELIAKSVYIPNGMSVNGSVCPTDDRLLYISRIDHRHGALLLMLIQVLPALVQGRPHLTLEIIGDGRLAKQVRRAGEGLNRALGRQAVILRGFQPQESPLQGTLLLGVGRSAMKALALGLPVLSVNHRHLGPLLSLDNYDRLKASNFVDVTAPKPMPETLLPRLIESLTILENDGADIIALRRRFIDDFDLTKIVRQTEAVYREIVN